VRGYDIDGVLVPRRVEPIHPYIVISGRRFHEWPRTIVELQSPSAIYLRPFGADGDHEAAGVWKAMVINLAGVTEFWEDVPRQAQIIRERCPACIVHLVS